jgi:hypothetical protein
VAHAFSPLLDDLFAPGKSLKHLVDVLGDKKQMFLLGVVCLTSAILDERIVVVLLLEVAFLDFGQFLEFHIRSSVT